MNKSAVLKWIAANKPVKFKAVNWLNIAEALFEAGLWVKLTTHRHGEGQHNPIWGGTEGYTAGLFENSGLSCRAEWINGLGNSYQKYDLEKITREEFDNCVKDHSGLQDLLRKAKSRKAMPFDWKKYE